MPEHKNRKNPYLQIVAAVILLVAGGTAAYGQTGNITGRVVDATNNGVPEAMVNAKNVSTAAVRSATTDASGSYAIPNLPVGHYDVTVEKQGFSALRFQDVELTVAQHLPLDGTLALGVVSQAVEVAGSAVPAINLTDAQITTSSTSGALRACP